MDFGDILQATSPIVGIVAFFVVVWWLTRRRK
jgi:hypothetical protein